LIIVVIGFVIYMDGVILKVNYEEKEEEEK
jgi:hypothetical protein